MRRTSSAVGLSASRLGPPSVAAPRRHLYASGSPTGSSAGCTEVGRPGRCRRTEAMEERWSVLLRFSHFDIGLAAAGVGPGSEELEAPLLHEWKLRQAVGVEDSGKQPWQLGSGASPEELTPVSLCIPGARPVLQRNRLEACLQPGSMLAACMGAEWQAGTGHCWLPAPD